MKAGRDVKVKKSCCAKKKRCKKCPAVWRILARRGLAERLGRRRYRTVQRVGKRDRRLADRP